MDGVPAQNRKNESREATTYAILSFIIGVVIGLLTIQTGFDFIYAGFPAHGPVPIIGGFYLIFGSLTVIGSIMVLIRNTRLFGAILILIFGVLSGGGTRFLNYIFPLWRIFGYFVNYFSGSLLSIVSFLLALYARKIDRAHKQP